MAVTVDGEPGNSLFSVLINQIQLTQSGVDLHHFMLLYMVFTFHIIKMGYC